MKKVTAIFFFAVYLFSTTEANELLKLPLVFEHFIDHKKADDKLTFLQYLALHYLDEQPKDGDYARDMKLPFKHCSDCVFGVVSAFTPLVAPVIFVQPLEAPARNSYFIRNQFTLSSYNSNIWQPPRVA